MLKSIRATLFGLTTLTILIGTLLIFFVPLFLIAFLKLLPIPPVQRAASAAVDRIAQAWFVLLNAMFDAFKVTEFQISGAEQLSTHQNYLVISNHQTWADILVLLYVINGRTPMFRFFLKREILYMPVLGFTCWALDFPFMKRYSREELARAPHKRSEDFAVARRATAKYSTQPVTVITYAEGTRLAPDKVAAQKPPYRYLLRPKAGGIGMVLGTMGDHLDAILDVTIVYEGGGEFWRFMSGQIPRVAVDIATLPVPPELVGRDYLSDPDYQEQLRIWINTRWAIKDSLIDRLLHAD